MPMEPWSIGAKSLERGGDMGFDVRVALHIPEVDINQSCVPLNLIAPKPSSWIIGAGLMFCLAWMVEYTV
jgi:hypothetical protein